MNTPQLFLGLDVGATKTHAIVADETGRVLGFGRGGPGNPEVVGYEALGRVASEAAAQALARAGARIEDIVSAGAGVAGYDWPSQHAATLDALHATGLDGRTAIVNDAIVGLLAGAREGWGVAVVSGTGCNCRGWDRERREGRVLGIGPLRSEAAGATELVLQALRAVSHEWTRRGPATCLTDAFIRHAGARDLPDLLEGLTTFRYRVGPDAAPLVFAAAAQGDSVARETVEWAGCELAEMAVAVIRQLQFERLEFDVVLVGSLYDGGPLLTEAMFSRIHATAPGARPVRLSAPPALGGVLLAMERAGLSPVPQIRDTLIQTSIEFTRQQ